MVNEFKTIVLAALGLCPYIAAAVDLPGRRPRLEVWKRMINIGLPAGGEFGLMFVYMAVIYWVIRSFGPAAQAGFGLGGA